MAEHQSSPSLPGFEGSPDPAADALPSRDDGQFQEDDRLSQHQELEDSIKDMKWDLQMGDSGATDETGVEISALDDTFDTEGTSDTSVSFHPNGVDKPARSPPRRQSSKYEGRYALKVDPTQEDRAAEIRLCSFARPHMRAFHYAW